jgi:hypothetical protein
LPERDDEITMSLMIKNGNSELIKILNNHVKEIDSIKNPMFSHYNYSKANELLQKTKMYASKYFPLKHYGMELIGIRFEPLAVSNFTTAEDYKNAWTEGIIKIDSIAKAMAEDITLSSKEILQVKVIEDFSKINQVTEQLRKSQKEMEQLKSNFSQEITKRDSDYMLLNLKFNNFKRWTLFISSVFVLSTILWSFNSIVKWDWLSTHPKKIALYIAFQFLIIFSLMRIITSNKAIKVIDILIALLIAILSLI